MRVTKQRLRNEGKLLICKGRSLLDPGALVIQCRLEVFEILNVDDKIASLILSNDPLSDYRNIIKTTSRGLLSTNALELLQAGKTSFAEISPL